MFPFLSAVWRWISSNWNPTSWPKRPWGVTSSTGKTARWSSCMPKLLRSLTVKRKGVVLIFTTTSRMHLSIAWFTDTRLVEYSFTCAYNNYTILCICIFNTLTVAIPAHKVWYCTTFITPIHYTGSSVLLRHCTCWALVGRRRGKRWSRERQRERVSQNVIYEDGVVRGANIFYGFNVLWPVLNVF